ncbi:MAG: ABC transporter [Acidobacteria bacterium]|nr:MAG: ABC transporter [Acidobacteriota bacterium]
MSVVLRVSRLSARRGRRDVLRDVAFSVLDREILGVIGPNGAGKTTLFECVAGVLPRTSGTIDGEPLFYVPDAIRPWPDQTVRWTLELNARMFGARADASLLDALDLTQLLDQTTASLSKGEAKRLNIALGLSVPRPILFLDEPFDGLDFRQTRHAIDVLKGVVRGSAAPSEGALEAHTTRRTLVLSIHQLSDAARVCDRFLLLDHGRIVGEGTLDELGGNLEEAFLART